MPEYLVAIAGDLEIDTRMQLADAGFREAAQVSYELTADEAKQPSAFRRIVYRYAAVDDSQAVSDALAIVGTPCDLRIKPR
jgi:hypothetical protein